MALPMSWLKRDMSVERRARGRVRLGGSPAHPRRLLAGALLLALANCRIYRKDRSPGAEPESATIGRSPAPGAAGGAGGGEAAPAPSAESLSLWVLSRSENDLKAQAPEAPSNEPSVEPRTVHGARALIVLGIGRAQHCADEFAAHALDALLRTEDPSQALSALLDELRRFRWPGGTGTLQAAQQGSDGSFGAVQAASPAAFSPALLDAAVQRRGVIDGQHARFAALTQPAPEPAAATATPPPGCDSSAASELRGPAAVLMRSAAGRFYGGLIELTGHNDAGLISVTTQFGVSLAMGDKEAVVLVSDCPDVPRHAWAENARRQLERGQPGVKAPAHDCQIAHALITGDEAWVSNAGSIAWATVAAPPASRQPTPAAVGDAGAPEAERDISR